MLGKQEPAQLRLQGRLHWQQMKILRTWKRLLPTLKAILCSSKVQQPFSLLSHEKRPYEPICNTNMKMQLNRPWKHHQFPWTRTTWTHWIGPSSQVKCPKEAHHHTKHTQAHVHNTHTYVPSTCSFLFISFPNSRIFSKPIYSSEVITSQNLLRVAKVP